MSTPEDNSDTNGRQRVIDKIAARFRKQGRERTAAPAAKHPPSLKRLILRGAGALVWGTYIGIGVLMSHLAAPIDNLVAQESRGLTSGEAALTRAILGQHFDTDSVRLRFHDGAPDHPFNNLGEDTRNNTLAYVNGRDDNNVHVIDRNYYSRDYSLNRDMGMRGGVFMHELVHIWQHRTGRQAAHCDTYEFTLTPQSRFEDFCSEQQAEIIRAYAVRFIIPSHPLLEAEARFHSMFRSMGSTYEAQLNEYDTNLARIVEAAFPHAAASRLRIQANFNNAAVCTDERSYSQPKISYQTHFNHCAAIHIRTVNGENLEAHSTAAVNPSAVAPPAIDDLMPAKSAQARPARPPQPG